MATDGDGRLRRIVEHLDLHPGHDVLEIGCGHGVAATLVCERLERGRGSYLGVDRSEKMVAAAAKRNSSCVDAGMAKFEHGEMERLALPGRRFDRVLAVRVGLFWKRPDEACAIARALLVPGGTLHVH